MLTAVERDGYFSGSERLPGRDLVQKVTGTRVAVQGRWAPGLPGRKQRAQGAVPAGRAGPMPARCLRPPLRL